MKKMVIISIIALTILTSLSISDAGWLIYHKPEFKGRVLDAETKEPIEGAVVVVVYYKHSLISGPGGGYTSVVKVKETLTDGKGEFRFPPYTTLIQPNSIEDDAVVTIYKPGYLSSPEFQIWALPEGLGFPTNKFSSTLKKRVDDKWKHEFEEYLKTIPEKERGGLRRSNTIEYLRHYLPILLMDNAKERLKRLEIPFFEIPDDVDLRTIKFIEWTRKIYPRNIDEKSDYVVYGLSKALTKEERLRAIPSTPTDIGAKELPLLYKIMNEGEKKMDLDKATRRRMP